LARVPRKDDEASFTPPNAVVLDKGQPDDSGAGRLSAFAEKGQGREGRLAPLLQEPRVELPQLLVRATENSLIPR
jgi:hypothetical protein